MNQKLLLLRVPGKIALIVLSIVGVTVERSTGAVLVDVGQTAPDFDAVSVTEESVSLSALRGKVVVLNFWFIACPPCRVEMPKLNSLVEEYSGQEVAFISLAPDTKEQLLEFLSEYEFLYEVIPNATPIAELYSVNGAPTHLIIDKEGTVTFRFTGVIEDPGARLALEIDSALRR